MAYLDINGKEFHAQTTFKFERLANEKYSDLGGEKVGGFMAIYLGLLDFDPLSLFAFWDCALHHYKKDKPSYDQIEEVLEEKIIEDEVAPFKEVFKVLDDAAFFRKRVKDIWKELETVPEAKEDETKEERTKREKEEQATKIMLQRRKELTA